MSLTLLRGRRLLKRLLVWPALLAGGYAAQAQAVPNPGENIQFLSTFSPRADPAWGDDDFT